MIFCFLDNSIIENEKTPSKIIIFSIKFSMFTLVNNLLINLKILIIHMKVFEIPNNYCNNLKNFQPNSELLISR